MHCNFVADIGFPNCYLLDFDQLAIGGQIQRVANWDLCIYNILIRLCGQNCHDCSFGVLIRNIFARRNNTSKADVAPWTSDEGMDGSPDEVKYSQVPQCRLGDLTR